MGWFKRKPDHSGARAVELNGEIAALEHQIAQLQDAVDSRNPEEVRTAMEQSIQLRADPILRADESLAETFPRDLPRDAPGLYNEQGVRKFDLHGWWQRLKKTESIPEPTPNEKLVTYLAAGRNHGYTALRKETRVARNRFILLTLVLIAVLWSILSLLIPQL